MVASIQRGFSRLLLLVVTSIGLATVLVLSACTNKETLSVGDKAPSFALAASNGSTVSLSDFLGKTNVLLYFNMAYG